MLEVCPPSQAILDFHIWAWLKYRISVYRIDSKIITKYLIAMPCLAALPILSPPLGCTIFTNCSRYLPGFFTGMLERGIFNILNNNNNDYHRFRYFSLIITSKLKIVDIFFLQKLYKSCPQVSQLVFVKKLLITLTLPMKL